MFLHTEHFAAQTLVSDNLMAPFTEEQKVRIVTLWGELKSVAKVRRKFAQEYGLAHHRREIPGDKAFKRVIDRFLETGSVHPKPRGGHSKTKRTPENAQRVQNAITGNNSLSVRKIAAELDLDKTTVWRILRLDLKLFPFRSHTVTRLTEEHKRRRVLYRDWFLNQDEDLCQKIIYTDEKIFEGRCHPNRQNERYWAPQGDDPEVFEEIRVQGGDGLDRSRCRAVPVLVSAGWRDLSYDRPGPELVGL